MKRNLQKIKKGKNVIGYLHDINLFSRLAPYFKLLIITLCILSDSNSAHL